MTWDFSDDQGNLNKNGNFQIIENIPTGVGQDKTLGSGSCRKSHCTYHFRTDENQVTEILDISGGGLKISRREVDIKNPGHLSRDIVATMKLDED